MRSCDPPKKPEPLSKPAPKPKPAPTAPKPASASKRVWRMYPKTHRNAHLNVLKADKDQVLICQICKLSIQDLSLEEIELAHCRMCSSHYPDQKEYVCSKCYEISSHISANCYMSVVDIT